MSSTYEVLKEVPTIQTKDICENMEEYAKSYTINSDLRMSDFCVSAVVCDSINFIGSDIDYNLRTSYLHERSKPKQIKQINPNTLLNILLINFQGYFDHGIIDSIESRLNMYTIPETDSLDEDDSIDVLVDYLNYIASVNGIDKTFTSEEITRIKRKRKCLTISPQLRNR